MGNTMQPIDSTPHIKTIGLMQPLVWLVLGWRDIARAGWLSIGHGLALSVAGIGIVLVAHNRFWLLAGSISGFLVVAPALATSLYALSRAIERREKPNFGVVTKTWLNWHHSSFNKWGNEYWCMVQFGALLGLAATGWVLTSAALITLLAPVPIDTPLDFVKHVMLNPDSQLFSLWLALGGVMAAPMFASSVVAMPLLLDRRLPLLQAILTSWKTVLANPLPMAFWASLLMGFTLLGLASLMIGLVLVIPMLGHASWHAYRDLVDHSMLPLREPASAPDSRFKAL